MSLIVLIVWYRLRLKSRFFMFDFLVVLFLLIAISLMLRPKKLRISNECEEFDQLSNVLKF